MKRIRLKLNKFEDREKLILALSGSRFIRVVENKISGKITHEYYVIFDIQDYELIEIEES